jgi:pimeloyl-ACP methyl ester carboxylesterase
VAGGGLHAVADETVSRWFGAAAEGPEAARARASLMRMRPEGFDAAWRAFAAFGGYEGRALPPTLALAYGDDLSTPPAVLDGIAAAIRAAGGAARRETIPGAGHMGLLQAPRETGAAIASFLEARR